MEFQIPLVDLLPYPFGELLTHDRVDHVDEVLPTNAHELFLVGWEAGHDFGDELGLLKDGREGQTRVMRDIQMLLVLGLDYLLR